MNAEEIGAKFKAVWTAVSAVAVIVIKFISELVTIPPTLWRDAGSQPAFVSYVVTLIVAAGICSVMVGKAPGRPTTGLIVAGILAVIVYFVAAAELSCPFVDGRMSIGWSYLPPAAEYMGKHPQLSCSLLIADFTGNTDGIWPRGEIIATWLLVLTVYMTSISLIATIVVRTMQSLIAK